MRSFLKWAGGKFELYDKIETSMNQHDLLIEPFVGGGSVFLRSNFKRYIINDINPDLIELYRYIQSDCEHLLREVKCYFTPEFNTENAYYALRDKFNSSVDLVERCVLFLFFNRHGYHGLCRYNRSGEFNVPFGHYKNPLLPEQELRYFANKLNSCDVAIYNLPFEDLFKEIAPIDAQIYNDPPYLPLSQSSSFTQYSDAGFKLPEHLMLHENCQRLALNNSVLLSNSNTKVTQQLYQNATRVRHLKTRRKIASRSNRKNLTELLVEY